MVTLHEQSQWYFIKNELNRVLGHMLNWAKRTSWGWWDEWDDTPLRIRHRIWNSRPGGLRPSTLHHGHDAPHNIKFYEGKKHFYLKLKGQSGVRTRDLLLTYLEHFAVNDAGALGHVNTICTVAHLPGRTEIRTIFSDRHVLAHF